MPIETLKLLYNAIIQPHFDYSDIVYNFTSKTNKDRLQKLQTRACILITGSGPLTSRIPMFHELNWLSLQYRRDFHKIVMVYKCWNGLAPQYLCDIFNANHDIHNHNTRNASLRVTKHAKARTAYYHGSLHSLVKGYGMIFQIILNFVHLYLVLKMPCTSIWLLSHSFKRCFSWQHIFTDFNLYAFTNYKCFNHVNMYILFDWCMNGLAIENNFCN